MSYSFVSLMEKNKKLVGAVVPTYWIKMTEWFGLKEHM